MRVQILYFARSRELAGTSEESVEVEEGGFRAQLSGSNCGQLLQKCVARQAEFAGTTCRDLVQTLLERHPSLEEVMGTCVLALNQEYVQRDSPALLRNGDEVALIPPISGG